MMILKIRSFLKNNRSKICSLSNERGATFFEYLFMLALLVVLCLVGIAHLGQVASSSLEGGAGSAIASG